MMMAKRLLLAEAVASLIYLGTLPSALSFTVNSRSNPFPSFSIVHQSTTTSDGHGRSSIRVFAESRPSEDVTRRDFTTSASIVGAATLFGGWFPQSKSAFADDGGGGSLKGPVTVIGANGRTGCECVKALQARSVSVRACTRGGNFKGGNNLPGVESLICDVTDKSTIEPVVKGASAVIFAASASKEGGTPAVVDNEGLVSVAKACIDAKVKQLVIVSSGAVTKPDSPVFLFLNVFGKIMEEKIKGEDAVRAMYAAGSSADQQGLSYTVVRPGGLTEVRFWLDHPCLGIIFHCSLLS